MRSLRSYLSVFGAPLTRLGLAAGIALLASVAGAQPANDDFANATVLNGSFGSVAGDNGGATAQPGEPSHGGYPASVSIWYKWTAPSDGEVTMDTIGSGFDTMLAVYSGTNLSGLYQQAANDDYYPFPRRVLSGIDRNVTYYVPLTNGPSILRFNATSNAVYYIAVDSKSGMTGPVSLNWAYNPSGTFRFASDDYDLGITFNRSGCPSPLPTGKPMFKCSQWESVGDSVTTYQTYYTYDPLGVLVTITRVGGANGKVLVDYTTQDLTALAGLDYEPVSGTLVFDDFEMSKTIVVPIYLNFLTDCDNLLTLQSYTLNHDFTVELSNARLDSGESPDVLPPPRVEQSLGSALVRILSLDLPGLFPDEWPDLDNPTNNPTADVFNFGKSHYYVPEDVNDYYSQVVLWVYRTRLQNPNGDGATIGYRINNWLNDNTGADENYNNLFPLQAASDYATPNPPNANGAIMGTNADFDITAGTITFGGNEGGVAFTLTITNDTLVEFNEDLRIQLWRDKDGPWTVGQVTECSVTIMFDDRDAPAGSVDELHNPDFGDTMAPPVLTSPQNLASPGADGMVFALAVQPDDRTVIAGAFTSYNTYRVNRIARMNFDGSYDSTFTPGDGANDFISAITLMPNGQFMIGGDFTSYDSTTRYRIARLNADGSLDTSFDPGLGANAAIRAFALTPSGKIVVAGDFTTFYGTNRPFVARLNADGSLDTTFDPGTGPNAPVNAVVVTANNQVIIGGNFTAVGNRAQAYFARLNQDGSLDNGFSANLGLGMDKPVLSLALQADGKILAGGHFTSVSKTRRSRIARINTNGSLDATFDPGTGADDSVYNILPQTAGIYIGGIFTTYNGTHRVGVARLFPDGTLDTGFMDTAYNQFAGLHRARFSDPKGAVFATGVQTDGNVIIGGRFNQVGGGQADDFIRNDPNLSTNVYNHFVWTQKKARDGVRNRSNVARLLVGSTPGPGNIGILAPTYNINRSQNAVTVGLVRQNGTLGLSAANFSVQPGTALSGTDFLYNGRAPLYRSSWRLFPEFPSSVPDAQTRMLSDGLSGTNSIPMDIFGARWFFYKDANAVVNVLKNPEPGDRKGVLQLANPAGSEIFYLGGVNIPLGVALGRSSAPLTVIDDNRNPGVLTFSAPIYNYGENETNALITVIRTNGSYGNVSVQYATTTNGSATLFTDYRAASGTLSFQAGQTTQTFNVPLVNNSIIQPADRTVVLRLMNVSGATLGNTNSTLFIVDDDYPLGYVNFTSTSYITNETSGGVLLTVTRTGGNRGTITVDCSTTNITAIAGVNYQSVITNLVWNDGDSSPRYIMVPLLNDLVTGPATTFNVRLSNPVGYTTNAPTILAGSRTLSTVTIIDDDSYGALQFSAPSYTVNENGGTATLTVVRARGLAETLSVNYDTHDLSAVSSGPVPNYQAVHGTLTFGPGDVSKTFTVPILNDGITNPPVQDFYFTVTLSGLVPAAAGLGSPTTVPVYIFDTQSYNQPPGTPDTAFDPNPGFNGDIYSVAVQSDGKVLASGNFTIVNAAPRSRIARLNSDASLDEDFLAGLSGANGLVRSMLVQSDSSILLGGGFTALNGVSRIRVGRLLNDGSFDTSFNPGSGANDMVFALAEQTLPNARYLLVGGSFSSFDGAPYPGLARLRIDGGLDRTFFDKLNLDGSVFAVAVYDTNSVNSGKILIGGEFSVVNGTGRKGLARLNSDGSLDLGFNPGTGASDAVRAIAIQYDGKILIGGSFTNFNGVGLNHFARLNSSGGVDPTFNVGLGADDTVNAILIQPDSRILLAGQFNQASGVSRGRITRLMSDGTVDPSINFGLGANNFINSIALQPNGFILAAGAFTQFDGISRARLARVYGGAQTGAGTIEFSASNYQVDETATNATVILRRRDGTFGSVTATLQTSPGTAVAGVNYSNVTSTVTFPAGETLQTVMIPVVHDNQITPDLTVNLAMSNISPPALPGDQPTATLTILNDDSSISFASATYGSPQNISAAPIELTRRGSLRGQSSVEFMTTTNGTAGLGTNYLAVSAVAVFNPGQSNVTMNVPVINQPLMLNDLTVTLLLSNAVNSLLVNPSTALLTIGSTNRLPGQFMFAQTNYIVGEGDGYVGITIIRTNGSTGTVTVSFNTTPGTAVPNLKYGATNGVLTFGEGETAKTIFIPILEEDQIEGDQSFTISLFNPTGRTSITGPTTVPVTIRDDDMGVGFSSPIFVASESVGTANLTVFRVVTNGTTTVDFATADGTAVSGVNYRAVSGTLTFNPGESIKTLSVTLFRDPKVTGDLSFTMVLRNPSAPAQLFSPSTATIVVLDADPAISFTNSFFGAVKSGTNVLITVVRSNANTGVISVNYATTNGTAIAGLDYVATSGSLVFSNGVGSRSFTVPIINNGLLQGDREFGVYLFTNSLSAGVQLLPPFTASITITDDISGFSFSSPAYTVNENGFAQEITVLRTGYTNSVAAINFSTADGSAKANQNYFATNGTFVFTNGETSKSFLVRVIDNSILDGNQTVLLSLTNPIGNAVLTTTNSAVLTIVETDGSLIIPAGASLLSESGPVNGILDTNETVTMFLALRNATGTNTENLVATLLNTNGIVVPGGSPNSAEYGKLVVRGGSVSRQFTFRTAGTNGQYVMPTLQLVDGGTTNFAVFRFLLGQTISSFSNSAPVVINDFTKATPYPSPIQVGGIGDQVNKVTVMVTNLYHSWPSDINMLLVSPTGEKSYLMSKAGGSFALAKTTITFDDGSPALPPSSQIVSGTNRPSAYPVATPPFPVPAPPGPYMTNLAVFTGKNPNGTWSLFVFDDRNVNSGMISNGWVLNLTASAPIPPASDLGVAAEIIPSSFVVTSNLTYQVTVTNYGPSAGTGVVVTDVLPAGMVFVSASSAKGVVSTNAAGVVTWSVGNMAKDESAEMTLVVSPTQTGLVANTFTVASTTADPNPDDDSATATALIISPISDLALGLLSTPNTLLLGDGITYTVTAVITNYGPATAPGLALKLTLPKSTRLVSASLPDYSVAGNVITFGNLGNLDSGARTSAVVVVQPVATFSNLNVGTVTSTVLDPLKADNTAAAKTEVKAFWATVSGANLVTGWPADVGGYVQESTTNFVPPVIWTVEPNTPYLDVYRNAYILTNPIDTGMKFFRLRSQTP